MTMESDAQLIRGVYSKISGRYDLANRLLSFGLDKSWRRKTAVRAGLKPGMKALDVAAGTLDLAIEMNRIHSRESQVVALDFSAEMINKGRSKPGSGWLGIIQADALELPFKKETFDVATTAFGIRNLLSDEAGLSEMARVLKPGGRCLALEFSMPSSNRLVQTLYGLYLRWAVPLVGYLLSGEKAYFHLRDSITDFPQPARFTQLMKQSGFEDVTHEPLTFGIVTLYEGIKPMRP